MNELSQDSVVATISNYVPIFTILTSAVRNVLNERGMSLDSDILDTIIVNKLILKAKTLSGKE